MINENQGLSLDFINGGDQTNNANYIDTSAPVPIKKRNKPNTNNRSSNSNYAGDINQGDSSNNNNSSSSSSTTVFDFLNTMAVGVQKNTKLVQPGPPVLQPSPGAATYASVGAAGSTVGSGNGNVKSVAPKKTASVKHVF